METAEKVALAGADIVAELQRLGCSFFVISPGSRSTPIAAAIARSGVRYALAYDERGAGFLALGYARATGRPAAVLTTSGTAVANLLPAVVEASIDHMPMILLTADRPAELRNVSANQVIDQIKIFGDQVRHFVSLPCSDLNFSSSALKNAIADSYLKATAFDPGPVQINCEFREPLTGQTASSSQNTTGKNYFVGRPQLSAEQSEALSKILGHAERGLVVLGALHSQPERLAVKDFCLALGWPVFADVTSGLRFEHAQPFVPYYDHLLLAHKPNADVILQIGGRFTSKRLLTYLTESNPYRHIIVHAYPENIDPHGKATDLFVCDLKNFPLCKRGQGDFPYSLNTQIHQTIHQLITADPTPTEPFLARTISELIADNMGLFLSSGMPIRDMDMFAGPTNGLPTVAANRGASGIDGLIATAAGFAEGLQKPTTLLIGDIAFFHDCSSLSVLREISTPLTIVLVNNSGSGIFSFLPVKNQPDIFSRLYETPHDFDFAKLCGAFQIKHQNPTSKAEFVSCYREAIASNRHTVIEVKTDRQLNHAFHERIKQAIQSEAL